MKKYSREDLCIRACEGIGNGELMEILEQGSTLKQKFEGVMMEVSELRHRLKKEVRHEPTRDQRQPD